MPSRFFLVAALVLLASGSMLGAADGGWKAGFARSEITPTKPMWMSGYAARTGPAEGKETELYCRVMALASANGPTLVYIALDLVGIDRELGQAVKKQLKEKHKLAPEAIAIGVSHTHCGPVVGTNLLGMYFLTAEQTQLVRDYSTTLLSIISKTVDRALDALQPVELSAGQGTCDFAVNRRENKEAEVPGLQAAGKPLKGPVDHSVPVLVAKSPQGKVVGLLFGYACHATTLSTMKWNADWPGYAAVGLEEAFPGAVACFFAGCGADQNPIPRRTLEQAKGYGKRMTESVAAVVKKGTTPLKARSKATLTEIDLPFKEIPSREKLLTDSSDKNKFVAGRAKALLAQLDSEKSLPKSYRYPVQTWQLDEQSLICLGGEVTVEYALRIKKEIDSRAWIMAYANDVMAYVPSLKVLREGGYEGETSMLYYGLPSAWGAQVEELIIDEVRNQKQQLKKQ